LFTLSKELLTLNGHRDLYFDETVRGLVAASKAHGRRPNQHENAVFKNQLCVNAVLRGRGRYTDRAGKSYELKSGTLFHRFPGVLHSTWYDPESDYAEFFITFDALTGRQLMQVGMIAGEGSPVMSAACDPVAIEDYKRLVKRIKMPENEFSSRNALLEAVALINRMYDCARSNRQLPFWEKVIEDACGLLSHDLEERVRPEEFAERLGVSYAAFRKHFTEATGYSPADYRIRRRLEASQHDLMHISVKEVAMKFGYFDLFAYSTQFKQFVGISPREFQRRMQDSFVLKPLIARRVFTAETRRRRDA
jgi:AraC-like DNA-binding protein